MTSIPDINGERLASGRAATWIALRAPANFVRRIRNALGTMRKSSSSPGKEVALRSPPVPLTPIGVGASHTPEDTGAVRALLLSFIVTVLCPTILAIIYFGFIASNQYLSEARLSVRAASNQKQQMNEAMSALSQFGASSAKSSIQDSYMILNYAKSKPIMEDIGGIKYLESIYSSNNIDYFSRLTTGKPLETASKYWASHVSASLNTLSGIVTIKVFAYNPSDAHALAERIVEASERLVNDISVRSRTDAVVQAQKELDSAQAKLVEVRSAMLEYRNRNVTIDPIRKAEDIAKLIVDLTMQKLILENSLAGAGEAVAQNSPAFRGTRSRLEEMDKKINELKQQLTATDGGAQTVSRELAEYERLKLTEQFAEKKYEIAVRSHERATQEANKQQLYLSTVVRPTMPGISLHPERVTNILLTFMCFFVIWGIFSMLTATVLDHTP